MNPKSVIEKQKMCCKGFERWLIYRSLKTNGAWKHIGVESFVVITPERQAKRKRIIKERQKLKNENS